MPASVEHPSYELMLLEKCREGHPNSLAALRNKFYPVLLNILRARGASTTEAEDLLADMWGDCVRGPNGEPSLLEKYNGKCPLQSWLATVATNRWIDRKRRGARQTDVASYDKPDQTGFFQRIPAGDKEQTDHCLVNLVKDSLQAAFARCSPEALLMLRLVYIHGLTQREIVRMWGWNESKISRLLSNAMAEIQTHTLDELRKRDPWLQLTWQDFLDLCRTHQIGFSPPPKKS